MHNYGRLEPIPLPPHEHRRAMPWWQVLGIGFALYIVGIIVLGITGNTKLIPAVFTLGSFVFPVAYVTFFYNHRRLSQVSLPTLAMTFFYGGILGVFAAALLEPVFVRRMDFYGAMNVGLIEEFSKILGVLVIARHRRRDSMLDGIILGAAAGMGFAALESTGFAFAAFLHTRGDLGTIVGITLFRGLLSPFGHGTWTAILAGVLFSESMAGYFRLDWKVLGAYFGVSALHGLWDAIPGAAAGLDLSGFSFFAGESVVGILGLYFLARLWGEAKRRQIVEGIDDQVHGLRRAA